MKTLNRRRFLDAGAGLLAVGALSGWVGELSGAESRLPWPFGRPLSFQAFGMRKQLEADFPSMLAMVRKLGYAGVEMCSPRGYERAGFGGLTAVAAKEIARIIADAGLCCKTCHFMPIEVLGKDAPSTRETARRVADYAAALGLEDVVMSHAGIGPKGTMDDFRRWGERCSVAGEILRSTGLRLGYHNHAIGPLMEDGKTLQYDLIMEVCDPELVKMQFQLGSIAGGFEIVRYLEKYAGRFTALHLHDYDPKAPGRKEGEMGDIVPCGAGIIDWPALFKAAFKSPITDHGLIVEIETGDPLDGLRRSIGFLGRLKI